MSGTKTQANKIRRYWTDPKFEAAFAGSETFFRALRARASELGLKDLKYDEVVSVLNSIPAYIESVRKKKGYERRGLKFEADESGSSFVPSVGVSYHADLGEMPSSGEGDRYFLILVDLMNLYTYVSVLKSKEKGPVLKAIKKIIADNQLDRIDSIGTDRGSEFVSNKEALAKIGVRLYTLAGDHKSFIAERRLKDIKLRLYRAARNKFSGDWQTFLQQVVDGLNKTPSRALAGVSPAAVNSPFSDPVIRELRREAKAGAKPLKKTKVEYKEGDYVYPDLKAVLFDDRSFHIQRGQIMRVKTVDKSTKPFLYTIVDLSGEKTLPKKFYAFQLRPAPEPFKELTAIDRIIEERVVKEGAKKKKKQALVQWTHYGPENRMWVDVDDIVGYKGLEWQKQQDEKLQRQREEKKKS